MLLPRRRVVLIVVAAALAATPACEQDDTERPPPARCLVASCGGPMPPSGGGGGGGGGDAGGTDGGATRDAASADAGAARDAGLPEGALQGTVLLVDDVVARSGTALSGARVSVAGSRAATADSRGRFLLEDIVEPPPLYLEVAPAGPRVGSLTLATSRTDAVAYAIGEADLVDAAESAGSTHGGTAGVVFVRVVDPTGEPRTGIVLSSPSIGIGPVYDRGGALDRGAAATDVGGAIAFFEVPPGAESICVRDATDTSEVCGSVPVEADVATFTTLVLP